MIRAAQAWPSNAEMIADVAKLGYIKGLVYDCTYGEGVFWNKFFPERFVFSDIKLKGIEGVDFTDMPWANETFDTVVFDPPYRLNGTPDPDFDTRYGTDVPATWRERMDLCLEGAFECIRVLKKGGHFLWKCQDQVSSGEVRWQTDEFTQRAVDLGCKKVDRFDLLTEPRPQPKGRRQVHAARCYSTLLVFRKV